MCHPCSQLPRREKSRNVISLTLTPRNEHKSPARDTTRTVQCNLGEVYFLGFEEMEWSDEMNSPRRDGEGHVLLVPMANAGNLRLNSVHFSEYSSLRRVEEGSSLEYFIHGVWGRSAVFRK